MLMFCSQAPEVEALLLDVLQQPQHSCQLRRRFSLLPLCPLLVRRLGRCLHRTRLLVALTKAYASIAARCGHRNPARGERTKRQTPNAQETGNGRLQ